MTKSTTFRSWALAVLAILALGACNRDWDNGRAAAAGKGSAATAPVTAQDAMGVASGPGGQGAQTGAVGSHGSFAALPDRGDLVGYPQDRVVRRAGAYTWHRADVSEEHALRAIVDGELRITAPNGEMLAFEYERHVEHPTGDWTWVGRLRDAPPGRQAILTFGAEAVFGNIAQATAAPLRLAMRDGASWLVETDPALLAGVESRVLRPEAPDFLLPPIYMGNLSGPSASGDMVSSSGSPVESSSSTSSSATTVVDVLVGYTSGFAAAQGGDSQARTRINFLIDVGNQGFLNSQVDARVRLVHAMQVNYPDATENGETLQQLTGYDTSKSGSARFVSPDPRFSSLRQARETYGADLVTLVRKFNTPENDGCGIAWLIGGGLTPITQGYEYFGYSVVSDGIDQGDDGKNYYCREETMVHEFGHNMGSAHDIETAKGEDGVLDNPDDYGRYTYSFGYKTGPGSGDFYTIMAYGDKRDSQPFQKAYRVFSNPNITFCGSFPCGTSGADNARSLRQTIPIIANFRMQVVPDQGMSHKRRLLRQLDANGDGGSDLFFFLHEENRFAIWYMLNGTRLGTSSTPIDGRFSLVDAGDFNADGRDDLLFLDPAQNRLTMAISNGSGFALHPLSYDYPSGYVPIAVIDVNGGGRADILFWHAGHGRLLVWYMSGVNRVAYNTHVVGSGWEFVGAGDFNKDGRGDSVWTNGSRQVKLLISRGTVFDQYVLSYTYRSTSILVDAQDVNGDGRDDLIFIQEDGSRVMTWHMNGRYRTGTTSTDVDPGFHLVGKGYFNPGARGDLLSFNPATRRIRYLLFNGSGFTGVDESLVPKSGSVLMDEE